MEKAILKTLIYSSLFDYPLKAWEIHKWLIGQKLTLRQVEKGLLILIKKGKVKTRSGYYFLPDKKRLVEKRINRQHFSNSLLKKAEKVAKLLKIIPWIKLVGISGNLAMDNASKNDDIDFFIITAKNRLWTSRLMILGLLDILRIRRKKGEKGRKIAQKICVNLLLEEDSLGQSNKDIYLAHEVLQMKVLWQKDDMYKKYLEENSWAFNFLPNWSTVQSFSSKTKNKRKFWDFNSKNFINPIEKIFKKLQLSHMGKPKGLEKISNNALYLHPQDYRPFILQEYLQRCRLEKIV
ncbi:hypothetical protein HYS93_00960 [Candidatus Daviesbacteria bacterium]|nr:hypothetical protein [Candidatus Daviesbacteria bacterium]